MTVLVSEYNTSINQSSPPELRCSIVLFAKLYHSAIFVVLADQGETWCFVPEAPGSTDNVGRYISLIVNFCTVGWFLSFSTQQTSKVSYAFLVIDQLMNMLIFFPHWALTSLRLCNNGFLTKVKVRETCSSNSETSGLFTFKSW